MAFPWIHGELGSKESTRFDQKKSHPLLMQLRFLAFLFEDKEDRDTIFRNIPYVFGTRGMYLNQWT
jgi:hypothetical protein